MLYSDSHESGIIGCQQGTPISPSAIALVLFSAVCHAGWNYFSHGFRRPLIALWLMTATGLLLCTPLFLATSRSLALTPALIALIIVSGLAKSGYFITLAWTYRYVDLSVGYPLSRTGIVLVPIWAYLFLGETISALAGVAIIVILAGIYVLNLPLRRPTDDLMAHQNTRRGIAAALATALLISVYSVIDKRAMDTPQLDPISFLFLMFISTWLGMTPYVLATNRWTEIKQEIGGKMGKLVLMALFGFTGYGAVLAAMELSKVSYIVGLRQTSLVLGAIMGATLLGEKHGVSRVAGAVIILLGALLVSISK